MQPGQVAAVHTIDLGEVARDDHFTIGLKSDRSDQIIGSQSRFEAEVQVAIRI